MPKLSKNLNRVFLLIEATPEQMEAVTDNLQMLVDAGGIDGYFTLAANGEALPQSTERAYEQSIGETIAAREYHNSLYGA